MKEWCWINIVYQYSKNALSCSSCSYQLWELREHSRYLSTWKHEAWERSIFSYYMPVPLIAILPIFHFFLLDWFLSGKYPSESYLYGSWGRVLVLIFFLVWECHYFFLTLFFFLIFKFILVALYGMWDASSPIRGQIHAHALQGYWTTREVPFLYYWIIVYKHIEFYNYFS